MSGKPDVNDRFPIRESLSPPVIVRPVFECAEAVYVTGFMAHARVRVFAGLNELIAEAEPPFGFETIPLKRPVKVNESLTATQEVNGQSSGHSIEPVLVLPLDGDKIRNTKPRIIAPLFECGRVVPVDTLVPSTRLHVTEDGAQVGQAAVAQPYHAVVTQPLKAGSKVSAVQIACAGTDHEVKGPAADDVAPLAAPLPPPPPAVDAASLIPGNDTVTLTGLLVGAAVEIFDNGALVSSGWLATGGANWFPLDKRLSTTPITATQSLCGQTSAPSAPEVPSAKLQPPVIVGPICAGARHVVVRGSTINATVVLFRNGQAITHGGAAPGDLVLALGQNVSLGAGSVVTARQYMNGSISEESAPVTVTSGLSEPAIEIVGGHPFFRPKGREEPIPGPVFIRGRGAGPAVLVQACCTEAVRAWITGPGGEHVADLQLEPLYSGYFRAVWPWTSESGWPVPDGIPVGQYTVHARSACQRRDGAATFFVIFDPDAVGGPQRFSFDDTAVWFGTGNNSVRGLHYYLHCSDWRVFRIAIQACAGEVDPYRGAVSVARAEEGLFGYSLNYHTNDVVDLIVNYSEAQCADDAACLTALLRAVGIPAHPVTADAGLETGAANWTFDTWVEFLAAHDGSTEWRVLHPHEYPGEQPETRAVFGQRGVANKPFNDLIVMANENWVSAELDDGSNDVSYGRNECGEPNQRISKAAWVDELCEAGYWPQAHWDCTGVSRRSLTRTNGFRLVARRVEHGGRLAGTVFLGNHVRERLFGRLAVELVGDRLESKAFGELYYDSTDLRVAVDPGEPTVLPFEFQVPETVPPGIELYLRARLDDRTALLQPVRLPTQLQARLKMPRHWQLGEEDQLRIVVRNRGGAALRAVAVEISAPYALDVSTPREPRAETLAAGEEREFIATARAVAELVSGSLHVSVATANGGGVKLRRPFRIAGEAAPLDTRPGLRPPR